MHIAFAVFADAANLSQEGKLNVLGIFDAVRVSQLPTIHPRTTLVVRLKGEAGEAGRHRLTLRWTSPSGEDLWKTDGDIDIAPPPRGLREIDLPVIAALDLPLDSAGTFTLTVELDGATVSRVSLEVDAAAAAFAAAPGTLLS